MNFISTDKLVYNKSCTLAGREWWYNYRYLPELFSEDSIKMFVQQLARAYSKITKEWNDDLNSQWICRIYMGMKMVLSCSVMSQSLLFAGQKNLRVVVPYLEYYSVLSMLRAVVFTSPLAEWASSDIVKMTHSKTINIVIDILAKLDRKLANDIKEQITYLKAYRELISYRAPSTGDSHKEDITVLELCKTLAELAQLQSEVFEGSVQKYATGDYILKDECIRLVCNTNIDGIDFFDEDDAYRLKYLKRKYPFPTNILQIMAEGHLEDFFGSWCSKDEPQEGNFCPDDDWRVVFDLR